MLVPPSQSQPISRFVSPGQAVPASPSGIDASLDVRAVDDPAAIRQSVYSSVENAAKSIQPFVGPDFTLRLSGVGYDKEDPGHEKKKEKMALLEKASLARRLRGTWELIDNASGKTVDSKNVTIANVPSILHDGSFIHKGTRYAIGLQQRLRAGVYTRRRASGEPEAQINVKPRHGRSHRYYMEPKTGVFFVNVEHAKIPMVSLLDAMGASREDVEARWGKELADVNYAKVDGKSLGKLYDRLVPKGLQDREDRGQPDRMKAKIQLAFEDMLLDPDSTEKTIGKPAEKVDLDVMFRATDNILKLAKGERKPDDRDHLAFATFHGPEDIFAERIKHDYDRVQRELFRKASRRGNLSGLSSAALDKQIKAAIFRSGLARTLEDNSPAELLGAVNSITRYGEGGLPDTLSTPDEARNVSISQFGFVDSVTSPESLKVGVDGYLARNTFLGKDNKLYTKLLDNQGNEQLVSPGEIYGKSLALGSSPIAGYDLVIRDNKMQMERKGAADYRLPHFEEAFSQLGSLVPLKSMQAARRSAMGIRMATSAMPIKNAEAPLVQVGVPGQQYDSFENQMGERFGAVRAKEVGRVLAVTPDEIKIRYPGGKTEKISLDNNRPGGRKTVYHQTALVKPGQDVQPGQLLAKSNFTDDNGVVALGRNLRTAFMSRDDAWEDGIVISESAAKKLTVDQAYKHHFKEGDGDVVGKKDFIVRFGGTYDKDQLERIDDTGVIAVGSEVRQGDPLVLGVRNRVDAATRVHSKGKTNYTDASIKWEHAHPGVVTDVIRKGKQAQVVVRTHKPMEAGDKLTGRFGNKGVVVIRPDAEMPHDKDGNHIEMIHSPLAVPSRGNVSFPTEMLLAKVAKKRGKAYRINDFDDRDLRLFAEREAKKHGVSLGETLTDPRTGRTLKDINVGYLYNMAQTHIAESKSSARGLGSYNAEGLPARGPAENAQAKRSGGQQLFAELSHGAYELNREVTMLRGQRNDDYWAAFMAGQQIGEPQVPTQYESYVRKLQAAGIRPVRKGRRTQLMAMTDNDVTKLAGNRVVTKAETVDLTKDLKPIPGGLMDPKIFGEGDRFAVIELSESMPNPAFEEPIRRMLGMTEKQFREKLGENPEEIRQSLKDIDLDTEIEKAREEIKGARKVARDNAVRRMRYYQGLKKTGVKPEDLMITKVPVMPPAMRPISRLSGSGAVMSDDANSLYRQLMLADENLRDLVQEVDDVADERLSLYDAHKALVGLADPASRELKQRKVKGILKKLMGNSPKNSHLQRKLLSGNVDNVARGVIMVDTNLDMDEIGVPESMAFKMFEPYIVRNLSQRGIPRLQALKHLKDRDDKARQALVQEMDRRPVTFTRAPILHRGGDLGFMGKLVKGDAIRLPPMAYSPIGGDNDGDAGNLYVPHGPKAVAEVLNRMLPSKMLTSAADFERPLFKPSQDHLLGLHQASTKANDKKPTRYFDTFEDAQRAFKRGEIDVDTPLTIVKQS